LEDRDPAGVPRIRGILKRNDFTVSISVSRTGKDPAEKGKTKDEKGNLSGRQEELQYGISVSGEGRESKRGAG